MGIMLFLGVFIGGGIGSLVRWGFLQAFSSTALLHSVALVVVNFTGSALLGYFSATQTAVPQWQSLAITVGFLGGLTTFSTYSMDIIRWFQEGQVLHAASFIFLNNALSLLGCYFFWQVGLRNAA